MRYIFVILYLALPVLLKAQNTMSLGEKEKSPDAQIDDVAWIAGHWHGLAFSANADEIWTKPEVGTMMGMYRAYDSDTVTFYEFMTITEEDNSLLLRIKHFSRDLKGWEARDKSVEFRLVRATANKAFFEGFTFERIDDSELNIYVRIEGKDGKSEEVRFNYLRVK